MNVEILKFVIESEHEIFVELAGKHLGSATGIAKKLIAENGDISVLKGKQKYIYERCISPLFDLDCDGLAGEGTCTGDGKIDEDSLLSAYMEEDFLCQHCRFDSAAFYSND